MVVIKWVSTAQDRLNCVLSWLAWGIGNSVRSIFVINDLFAKVSVVTRATTFYAHLGFNGSTVRSRNLCIKWLTTMVYLLSVAVVCLDGVGGGIIADDFLNSWPKCQAIARIGGWKECQCMLM